ncbi:hypothetical protein MKX64_04110 [Paenibacillus sp. FSL M8-0334]|uniref:hypothetical protein n=1 Tax=Paenibacillus sp. FSL M8-0334 TaxID=2921623 RepID=UPI0030F56597
MKKVVMSFLGLALFLLFSVPFVSAQSLDDGPSPPPDDEPLLSISSLFDPNYKFLYNGGTSVSHIGNSKISISGYSTAKQRVDTIGVQLTLQRWTGSDWVDIYRSPKAELSTSANTYTEHEVTVIPGYYYRSKSSHWTLHGTVKETGTLYSGFILIPDR